MRFIGRRSGDNPNFLVGLFLLILLAVFMGPNVMPRIITSISPSIDAGVPCAWLHQAVDLANHQSLIGRASDNAIALEVYPQSIPLDPSGVFEVDIVVVNTSLGTVPIIYAPNQVNIGDNGTSGLGLIFDPGNLQATNTGRNDQTTYPEQNIRLLGPRQRCVHTVQIPISQLDPNIRNGSAQVRAFYRINSAGAITQPPNTAATPIYPDQGLNVISGGIVESPAVQLGISVQSQ